MTFAAPPPVQFPESQPQPGRGGWGCGKIIGVSALGCLGVILLCVALVAIFMPQFFTDFKAMVAASGTVSRVMGTTTMIARLHISGPGGHCTLAGIFANDPPQFGIGQMVQAAQITASGVHIGKSAVTMSHATLTGLRLNLAQKNGANNLSWEVKFLQPAAAGAGKAAAPPPAPPPAPRFGPRFGPQLQMQSLTVQKAVVLVPGGAAGATLRMVLPAYTIKFPPNQPHSLRYFLRVVFTRLRAALLKNKAFPPALRHELAH